MAGTLSSREGPIERNRACHRMMSAVCCVAHTSGGDRRIASHRVHTICRRHLSPYAARSPPQGNNNTSVYIAYLAYIYDRVEMGDTKPLRTMHC